MVIAFLTPEYFVNGLSTGGGLGIYVQKYAAALADIGFKVKVITLSSRQLHWHDGKVEIFEVKKKNCTLRFGKHLSFILQQLLQYWDRLKIRRIVKDLHRKEPFNLLHVSNFGYPGLFVTMADVPLVCRISSLQREYAAAGGIDRSFTAKVIELYENIQIKKADIVISPSLFFAKRVQRRLGIPVRVVRTMPEPKKVINDYKLFSRVIKGRKYVLYFGQMSRLKGTDLIGDVLLKIFIKYSEINLVCIGRDDGLGSLGSCKEYLLKKIPQSMHSRLIFLEPLSRQELYPFIENASCVLQPSRVDNLPNTCIESLSFEVPVVGADNSSLEELIVDGKNGYLFRNSDTTSFYTAICKALEMQLFEPQASPTGCLSDLLHVYEIAVKSKNVS